MKQKRKVHFLMVLVVGVVRITYAQDGSSLSPEDRSFFINQLAHQLETGSDLTDPAARIEAMSRAADYYTSQGDHAAADAQIKNAAFHLLNSGHDDFVREEAEASKLMRQIEELSDFKTSPETRDYVAKWKREVASRTLNENQVVGLNDMGN